MTPTFLDSETEIVASSPNRPPSDRRLGRALAQHLLWVYRMTASGLEWLFGVVSLVLGLSILAALPIAQFLSLGYCLESSGRVARTGRLRDGLIGVRKAAHVGGMVAGSWLVLILVGMVGTMARSSRIIDPLGPSARGWHIGFTVVSTIAAAHLVLSLARGGRLRFFLWPVGHLFWVVRQTRNPQLYATMRDSVYDFLLSLRLPYYFRLGLVGFFGTLAWLVVPAILIAGGQSLAILGVIGVILLALIVPFLPFLQVRYALEGRIRVFFSPGAIRDRFRRAPWAFAVALALVLVASIPLYLLKLEMIPREAAWLPSLIFVLFLTPARLLTGWAYNRSARREHPCHWVFRIAGRLAIIPVALLYVLVVFLAQYTSWGGVASLFEQHAFLLPVPFLNM